MLSLIAQVTSAVAKKAAHNPIHFIIVPSFLAAIAYLAIVDEYILEDSLSFLEGSVNTNTKSYYYPPTDSTASTDDWIQIQDVNQYPDAKRYYVVPTKFKPVLNHELPHLNHTIAGPSVFEPIIVSETAPESVETLVEDGITWKLGPFNRISKYYDYFTHALANIQDSIQKADNFDIVLIIVAYLAMWYTLIKVFIDMRQFGSQFWLAFSTLTSSVFAFLFGLFTSIYIINAKVSLMSLSEGIPFLVAIIGFKHKVSIAGKVSRKSTGSEEVSDIVAEAISSHTLSMLRDHVVVIGALFSCAAYAHRVTRLRNFCILSGLILTFDLILVYTMFPAILGLKVEIKRARRTEAIQEALEEEGISHVLAAQVAEQSATLEHPTESTPFFSSSSSILSAKVAMTIGLFAFHVFWLGSSWLYSKDDTESLTSMLSFKSQTEIAPLTQLLTNQVKVDPQGTIITIFPTQYYHPVGFLVKVEDVITIAWEKFNDAIQDSILSKFIIFGLAISVVINMYFLNAARYQVNATKILIEKKEKVTIEKNQAEQQLAQAQQKKIYESDDESEESVTPREPLPLDQCIEIMKTGNTKTLTNSEVTNLVVNGKLPLYALEKQLGDNTRAVVVRRSAIAKIADVPVLDTNRLPWKHYDYDRVFGACCENVIGYMPLPVGVAGPLLVDGKPYQIPMATTEGCLVASAMRGCKAINAGGGVQTVLTKDGMTRGPCVRFPTLARAGAAKLWIDSEEGQRTVKKAFNSTSRFARLQHIQTALAGTLLFIRFRTTTGDAMGMNMISKGVEYSLKYMVEQCGWEDMEVISVSGNYCIDKKPAAINWIEGRGKSIVAEARIPKDVVAKVLKSDVDALVELNVAKNLVGSAMAGSVGGFNAHAANMVTAIYLACGQDPAQNVESSNCITLMDKDKVTGDLNISVSMPSIEVGTIGGGTILEPQGAMLELLGVRGPHPTNPGDNARQLAKIVASAVLAAELSLCSALAAGHLVSAHMQHNRNTPAAVPAAAPVAAAPVVNGNGSPVDIKRLQEGSITCIKS
ncbi:3-hydroxy-3-methyl-glutaryl coenzyme A reductase (HMG-CoA) [Spathaspora passalidarum NRRL Y-27907]|uniref:3-hydroxy-3-methylglutaryl coenzyme A reductase n=1 Tax=Spathaspora passalidarum (strain NRRL Y-27907 / 11-Y1) TaxID=619300 RepID=G3AEK3_SPAPN|nr:3-hydroxy-3-methyl-glutaryl coenzyme A reductase (HMG-CoA) [Spathaspora passalidarum NRRL Y-27907]EGW34765.1 3-hydroxy-3-methyl-glutaryl coenzyme A reductase (HMG-CoA) [Spathaspora passalidarum NRRL Y-27907]